MNLFKNLLAKVWRPRRRQKFTLDETGQSLIILVFAFLGLIAMLGLALDLGLVYIERVRLKRTIDAAALAAVSELPTEEEAALTAVNYLRQNGYNVTKSNIYIAGCVQDVAGLYEEGTNGDAEATAPSYTDDLVNRPFNNGDYDLSTISVTNTLPISTALFYPYVLDTSGDDDVPSFFIDTRSFQSRDPTTQLDPQCSYGERVGDTASGFGSANKIKIAGQVPVRMNFMQFFGFQTITVSDEAVAQTASSLDVSLVLDTTGSMDFDTICYGCWYRCDEGTMDSLFGTNGHNDFCHDTGMYKPYPTNGWAFPYAYTGTTMLNLIYGSNTPPPDPRFPDPSRFADPKPEGTNKYIVMEAEFYSDLVNSAWDPGQRSVGQGYWAMQRWPGAKAYSIDGYGENYSGTSGTKLAGFVRHHPHEEFTDGGAFGRHYKIEDAQADFTNDVTHPTRPPRLEYDFMPDFPGTTTNVRIFVRAQYYNRNNGNTNPRNEFFWAVTYDNGGSQATAKGVTSAQGGKSSGACSSWQWVPQNCWSWFEIGSVPISNETAMHTLKIWAGSAGYAIDRIVITDGTNLSSTMQQAAATPGTASRLAADVCNPIFGETINDTSICSYRVLLEPVNNLNDALFDARNPIRGAQESMRRFVQKLDPQLDQVGFVDFATSGSNHSAQRAQMECIRASASRKGTAGAPASHLAGYPFSPGPDTDGDGDYDYPNYDEYNCSEIDNDFDTWAQTGANCDGYPDSYNEFDCFRRYSEANPTKSVPIRYAAVLKGIEAAYPPGGGTNIAGGLRQGLHLMGINTSDTDNQNRDCDWRRSGDMWQIQDSGSWLNQPYVVSTINKNPEDHCSRGQAATPIIVLLTDGEPNQTDDLDAACKTWLSDPKHSAPYEGFPPSTNDAYECILYYTDIAAKNGVIIYTIGLGTGANMQLLDYISSTTNGQSYFAPSSAQLDLIFDQILANVYIRLVQ